MLKYSVPNSAVVSVLSGWAWLFMAAVCPSQGASKTCRMPPNCILDMHYIFISQKAAASAFCLTNDYAGQHAANQLASTQHMAATYRRP